MVELTRGTDTLEKVPGSRGNSFLDVPRNITRAQFPAGYRQVDAVHVVIEFDVGNLILFRYDETIIDNVSFSSPQEMIDYIINGPSCSDVFYGYADPRSEPASAACTNPTTAYSYNTTSNTLYVHGQCGLQVVNDGYYSDGTTIFEARGGVLAPFDTCRR